MKNNLIWFAAILSFIMSVSVCAGAGTPLEPQVRYGHLYLSYVIHADGTDEETSEWSATVLKAAALDDTKRTSITYSTSVQKAEVIAAYTKKADGRRIDVPKDNYQLEVNSGKGKVGPVFSDTTTLTVVFPDVAVGDSVVLSYRLIQTEPLFPRQFSVARTFSRQSALDDVRVRFDYPATLWVQYRVNDMQAQAQAERAGRKTIEWRYANPRPLKDERQNYSVYDPDQAPGFAFSTFRSYADIAAAYGVRALPKAAVSDRIRKLAADIVKDKTAPQDQARALYEWVATNITYAGNCIGVGAVVPHDLPFVLDNKMGDCKDHATLLQALLAARGIKSTQALINAGAVYRLPKIPVVSTVNHVINYLPDLDRYLDSTSDSTPYGMLPFAIEDKPVLLVEGFRQGTKTPVAPVGSNQEKVTSRLKIGRDGSMVGTVEVFQKGQSAAQMRAVMRRVSKEWQDDFVKDMFRGRGVIGAGKFDKDDPTGLRDSYHYQVNFTREKFTRMPGPAAFSIEPLITGAMSISGMLASSMDPEKHADVVCASGKSNEEYVIELPATVKILAIPDDLKVGNDFLTYVATYRIKNNILTVTRSLDDRTRGNVCPPQVFMAYQKIADKVRDNLSMQVLYK